MVTAIAKGSPRERGSILGVVGGRGLILGIIAWLILSMPGPNPVARAQVGGAFPSFLWGARLKASFLEGVPAEDPFAALGNPAAGRGCDTEAVAMEQARPFSVPITAAAWCHGPWQ